MIQKMTSLLLCEDIVHFCRKWNKKSKVCLYTCCCHKQKKLRTKGAGECWRLAGQPDQAIPSYTGVGSKSLNTSVAPNPTLQPPTFRRTDSSLASLHAWTCSYNQEFAGPILLGTCAHPRMFSSTFTFNVLLVKYEYIDLYSRWEGIGGKHIFR